MKTKLLLLFVLFGGLFYFFTGSSTYESGSRQKPLTLSTAPAGKFLIGAMNTGYDPSLSHMDSLGFNLWHKYNWYEMVSGRQVPTMGGNDNLNADILTYKDEVRSELSDAQGLNMSAITARPKLEWLCYGQRSTYQCEPISKADDNEWFYAFNQHSVGDTVRDSANALVVRCLVNQNQTDGGANWVVKRLKSNTEQSNPGQFKGDSLSTWFIKPKIRISSYVAHLQSNPRVCRLLVKGQDGDTVLKDVDIRANDFLVDSNGTGYNGRYLEEYNFRDTRNLQIQGNWGRTYWSGRGEQDEDDWHIWNHADIQVYWYGECDMWIDYVRVDDDIAYDLFSVDPNNTNHTKYMNWLEGEATQIANHSAAYRFYLELFEYNNVPCMAYVNHKMDSIVYAQSGNTKHFTLINLPIPTFYTYHVPWADRVSVYSKTHFKKFYLDAMGAADFAVASYPFNSSYVTPEIYLTTTTWTRIPNTLPNTTGDGVLAPAVSPSMYDTWLQHYLDSIPYMFEPEHDGQNFTGENEPGHFRYTLQRADSLSKMTGKNFIFNAQAHIWKLKNWGPIPLYNDEPDPSVKRYAGEVQREPTNEELDLTTNIPISYGAKGIIYFEYTTTYQGNVPYGSVFYDRGIVNYDFTPRYNNIYGQEKWEHIKKITSRMKKWGPYLMSFDNEHRKSCIYRLGSERPAFLSDTYFADIVSYKTGTGSPSCTIPSPNDNPDITPGLIHECNDDRYLQAAVFKNPNEQYSNYFMIVNRRCSPYVDASSEDNRGGRRYMSIRFDANRSEFDGFNNWSIIDVEADTTVASFDKRVSSFLNLEWFNPGQGKLYRVIPTMYKGGKFAGDENISDVTIDIDTTINTNGKNLTLGAGVTLNFKDNACIKMNGGNFICGTVSEAYNAPKSVTLGAQSGMKWGGICLSNMDTIHIQNTEVKDVDADSYNHGYAISLINSKVINIDNCNVFNTSSTAAGIQINYVTNLYMNPDINITGNTIKIETDTCDGIYIHPYSWLTLTPYIYANKIINTSSGGGEFGIFGFDLEGTAVKNNYIENFQNGILTWYSSLDLFENTIDTKDISNGWDLYGIVSEYNLSNAYESRLGGSNILTTKDGRNICLDALDINLTDGNNIFNVNDDEYGYHLAGYYPTSGLGKQNTNSNCFKIMGVSATDEYGVRKNVTESDGLTQVTFDFGSFNCPSEPNYCDFYIGGTPTDTVWIECGGMGGGVKSDSKLEKASAPQTLTYREIYDSLNINMRKKQYELAAEKCITLLDNYPDSAKVINCVDKLYRTALARNKVSELKSYYENFIQNHPNNSQIINRMFYYIQKAKARLGQYQSALQGFQTIMNQFPTSYEGLAARWDYMATQLLDTSSGSGGGEPFTINNEQLIAEQEHERLVNLVEDPLDKYDKKKFTKEDRKVIVNNIVTAFESQKTKETKKLKELEVKVTKNEANESEKKEYKTKSKLKEVVKPQKVRNISEQISVVQSDIKKVFPLSERKGNTENKVTAIPLEYKLSQNYPNPFNPTTKINYEIKNAGFVTLKIYDLLGREIVQLVNETKDAGRYSIDFNASKYMLASGIYFYRIKAGEFIDTKRMVLVK